jgi:hypothetical protein
VVVGSDIEEVQGDVGVVGATGGERGRRGQDVGEGGEMMVESTMRNGGRRSIFGMAWAGSEALLIAQWVM